MGYLWVSHRAYCPSFLGSRSQWRRVIDHHAALGHHLLKVPVADPVFAIPAHADQNYFDRKAATFEIGHGGLLDDARIIS